MRGAKYSRHKHKRSDGQFPVHDDKWVCGCMPTRSHGDCCRRYCAASACDTPQVAFDCLNQETTGPLLMSVLSVQVDNRWGDYSFCNLCYKGYDPYGHGPTSRVPRRCSTGEYVCDCSSRIGNSCNGTVGQLDVSSFFGGFQPDIAGSPAPDWKWWQYNTGE